jgi:hypothetical protein
MQQALGQDGRYRTVRRIDAGGMGEIWEADDTCSAAGSRSRSWLRSGRRPGGGAM